MPQAPFQFSMRTLLIATTAFAVWCAAVAILPESLSQIAIGLISYVLVAILAAGLLFGHGDERAFCLGALVVYTSMWTGIGGHYMDGVHKVLGLYPKWTLWLDLTVIVLTAVANGWFCVQARRFFQRES